MFTNEILDILILKNKLIISSTYLILKIFVWEVGYVSEKQLKIQQKIYPIYIFRTKQFYTT